MKAICLDSAGAWISEVSLDSANKITHLELKEKASPELYYKLPVLTEGFYDSHAHPVWMAKLKNQMNCRQKTAKEILSDIHKHPGESVFGFGWSEDHLNCSLDDFQSMLVTSKKRFFLHRICGHMALTSEWGVLKENELDKIPRTPLLPHSLQEVLNEMLKFGISETADLCVGALDYPIAKNYPFRIFGDAKDLKKFIAFAPQDRPPYIKFFLDGSLGARTAWLSETYSDQENHFGQQMWKDDELQAVMELALNHGFSLAFHSIGDASLDQLLKISKKLNTLLRKNFSSTFPHRIEHLQVCRDDQIEKLAQENFWTLSLQPSHRLTDQQFSLLRLGHQRLKESGYRLKSFLEAGLKVTLGSDAPIASFDPKLTLEAINTDSRNAERIDINLFYSLFCVEGRQNAGINAKKLSHNSNAYLSKIHL